MKRVNAGDPFEFPADVYNGLIGLLGRSGQTQGGPIANNLDRTVCLVRNDTGAAIPRFGVVGLGDPLILPSASEAGYLERFAFEGNLPGSGEDVFNWGLSLNPITIGGFGIIRVSGLAHCYVTMTPSETPLYVGPNGTVAALTEVDCGARVLWRATGTGAQRAIVVL